MPTLAIIIVSWNTRDLLHRSIQTIHASLTGGATACLSGVGDTPPRYGPPPMRGPGPPGGRLRVVAGSFGLAGGNTWPRGGGRGGGGGGVGGHDQLPSPLPHPPSPDY